MGASRDGMEKFPKGMSSNAAGGFECRSAYNSNGQAGGDHCRGRGRHERTMHVAPISTAAKMEDMGEIDMVATTATAMGFIPA